jgi:hypothetical protein
MQVIGSKSGISRAATEMLRTIEIGDERANWMLAAELESIELAVAK